MAFQTIVNKEDHLLHTTFTGLVVMDELRRQMGEYVALALENRCYLWLLDLSAAVIESVSLPDLLNHPERFRKATEQLRREKLEIKRALVLAEHQADLKFIETVSYNRGQSLRVFNTSDAALQWLKVYNEPVGNSRLPVH